MKVIHLISISILLLLFSCSIEQKKQEKEEETVEEEYVIEEEDLSTIDSKALYIEIDSLKKEAFSSEDFKIEEAKNILKEIKRSKSKVDKVKYKEAEDAVKNASKQLYSDKTFNNNEKVMKYDLSINEMIFLLDIMIKSVDNLDVQENAETSLKEISDASGRDTFTRGYYNNAVKKWNKMTKEFPDKLKKENPTIQVIAIDYFYGEAPL